MAGKPGRNDPCPCGSGKKYKKCCLDKQPVQTEEPPGRILQIKVRLQKVDPPIWRRLLVRGDTSLGLLHRIIQGAMGGKSTWPKKTDSRPAYLGSIQCFSSGFFGS